MTCEDFANAVIAGVWLAWVLFWAIAAGGAKATARHESRWSRLSHVVPLAVGVMLIALPHPQLPWSWLFMRILPSAWVSYGIGVALLIGGLGFTVWARLHLGRNWSGTVTLKEDHELIRSGPYRWVRHPIYTGLLTALLGCAIARGELRGLIGLVIAIASLIRKLRIEERWMREQFGEEYERYSAEVPALIPRLS